jgi:DNA polymerase III alpha subunit
MKQNKFGELIFSEADVVDLLMQSTDMKTFDRMIVDNTVDISQAVDFLNPCPDFQKETVPDCSVEQWHKQNQSQWHMPLEYKDLDIAVYVLNLCASEAELQRCGQELLLFQERDLFNLLRYLKYLVDVMKTNKIIWGVGRGSSVASFVLFKIGVHKIDSLYYNLDIHEFLR